MLNLRKFRLFTLFTIAILHYKIGSIRLPDETEKKLSERAKETERAKSFHIQKAIENYIEQFADYRIALDRINDSNDEIISAEEMRKLLDV